MAGGLYGGVHDPVMFDPFGLNSKGTKCLTRSALKKCTPLEPVPHNHVGPIDASKGHGCQEGQTSLAENQSLWDIISIQGYYICLA